MFNPHARLVLARGRQDTMLAEAEAARQARQARRRRSGAVRDTEVVPCDGSSLVEYEIMLEHTTADDRERVCC